LTIINQSSVPLSVYFANNFIALDAHSSFYVDWLSLGAHPATFVNTATGAVIDWRVVPEAAREIVVRSNLTVELINRFNFLRDQ